MSDLVSDLIKASEAIKQNFIIDEGQCTICDLAVLEIETLRNRLKRLSEHVLDYAEGESDSLYPAIEFANEVLFNLKDTELE